MSGFGNPRERLVYTGGYHINGKARAQWLRSQANAEFLGEGVVVRCLGVFGLD